MADYASLPQGALEEHVLRLALALNDIGSAGVAVEALLAHPSYSSNLLDGERHALGEAVISAYCRPFDKARGAVRLDSFEWPGYDRPDWQKQHGKLVSFRHAFVSHSELDSRRVVVESTKDPDGWHTRLDLPPLFMLPGEAERTNEMCRDIYSRLHDHLGQACRVLIARERASRPGAPVEIRIPRGP
jgi:hypothetical protein